MRDSLKNLLGWMPMGSVVNVLFTRNLQSGRRRGSGLRLLRYPGEDLFRLLQLGELGRMREPG